MNAVKENILRLFDLDKYFHHRLSGIEIILATTVLFIILSFGSGMFGRLLISLRRGGFLPVTMHAFTRVDYRVDEWLRTIPPIALEILRDLLGFDGMGQPASKNPSTVFPDRTPTVSEKPFPTGTTTPESIGSITQTVINSPSPTPTGTFTATLTLIPGQTGTTAPMLSPTSTPARTHPPDSTDTPTPGGTAPATGTVPPPPIDPPTSTPSASPPTYTQTVLPPPVTTITPTPTNPPPTLTIVPPQTATSTSKPTHNPTLALTPTSQYTPGPTISPND